MLTLTDQNFSAEVLQSAVPVLVDFWAPWCGPCKVMSPIVHELARAFAGKEVKVGAVNVDENQSVTGQFQIMSIPTFLFFKGGKVVDQLSGVQPKEKLREKLEKLIAS
jgi:thioredoxin 1